MEFTPFILANKCTELSSTVPYRLILYSIVYGTETSYTVYWLCIYEK